MRHRSLIVAGLAAFIGVTTAAASVPDVPSPAPRKAPVKAAPRFYAPPPGKGFIEAVQSADFPRLEQLFRAGYGEAYDGDYNNALHYAVRQCDLTPEVRLKLVSLLVAHGANIHRMNKTGQSPAMAAKATCGATPAMLALLVDGKPDGPVPGSSPRERAADLVNRGSQLFDRREWQGSLDAYTQAIALDPTSARAHFGAGLAHAAMGDWNGAIAETQLAVNNDPNNEFYKRALADNIRAAGLQVERKRQEQILAAQAVNNQGVESFKNQNFQSAAESFSKALAANPNDPQIRANLAAAQQAIAAQEQRAEQARQQAQQYAQAQAQARAQAQRDRNAELSNTLTQGLALGQQIAEANRPRPRPSPAPAYSSAPRQYATQASQAPQYRPPQAPARPANQHTPNPANNGTGCVHVVANPGNWGTQRWYFKNDCGWPVTVVWDRYTQQAGIGLGGHYPTGMGTPPSVYLACKSRPEIGAEVYYDRGTPMCVGPAA